MSHIKSKLFSSGLELGNLVASSDILDNSLDAISKTLVSSVAFKVHEYPSSGCNVLAFALPPSYAAERIQGNGKDLVSSEALKVDFPDHFDFISTKVNPSFSINKAAITAFSSLYPQLLSLKHQIDLSKPLIVTGRALAGSIASLFTLWLQHNIDQETGPKNMKRPICITFGSSLIGDDAFRKAILERPTWKSCFLHVVSNQDPTPRLFLSPHNASVSYMPFGTYLFSSESGGCACFDEHESIMKLMAAISSESVGNGEIIDYAKVLHALKENTLYRGNCGTLYRGISQSGEFDVNPLLKAGISLQLAGVLKSQDNDVKNELIKGIEKMQARLIKNKRNVYEPTKKLNDMKLSLTYMEWYMKAGKSRGGYYDSYKRPESIKEIESKQEIVKHQRMLVQYWKEEVEKKYKMPQKEGANLRIRWLFGGTNYRRIVEPLDIAVYYHKEGKRNYLTQGRSKHYILLEKWLNDDKKDGDQNEMRGKAVSLTEDSCFWAHVEEAIISCRALKDGERSQVDSLVVFENYVMDLIKNKAVSPDIFLEQSSFMQWWREYKEIRGSSYNSPLTNYMMRDYKSYA